MMRLEQVQYSIFNNRCFKFLLFLNSYSVAAVGAGAVGALAGAADGDGREQNLVEPSLQVKTTKALAARPG